MKLLICLRRLVIGSGSASTKAAGARLGPEPRNPKWLKGQMRIHALARMLSRGIRPIERESLERLRLSPITKYRSLGICNSVGTAVARPDESQQLDISVHGSAFWSGR